MKISFDKKIQAGFVVCSTILATVAIISFQNSGKFLEANRLVNFTHEVRYELEQILVNSINAETGARGYVITGRDSYLEPYTSSKENIYRHIQQVRKQTEHNPDVQRLLGEIESLINLRFAFMEAYIKTRKTEGFEKAKESIDTDKGKELQDQIRELIQEAKTIEEKLLADRSLASERDSDNFNILLIILLVVIGLTLLIVYFIITTNLSALRKAERETADNNWNLTGSSELVKSMQGNKRLNELCTNIINQLVNYLNAQIGAIYISDENNMQLRLQGSYAIDKRKADLPILTIGEGLVGQCALEKKMIVINDIPSEYFNITTGFGSIVPKHIVATPLVFENKIIGVIELGTLNNITELHQQYLNLVADSISIAVTSSQSREKTKDLLEETQRQAEELTAQQEELRQTNEELHTKTELLERSEAELKAQQEELKQINLELEEKANMLEDQKTKIESAKAEIESKASELELTSKYKSEFLANMSHELRTPLNSILILAQLLAENKNNRLGDKEIEYSKNIHSSGSDLLNLINEILDLSKVEAGKMELNIDEVSLGDVSTSMLSMFTEVVRNKNIAFEIDLNEQDAQATIISDKFRIEQILRNFLSNAVKFTETGGRITLTIGKPSQHKTIAEKYKGTDADRVAFSVSDNGIGIPKSKQGVIFEAFQQADGSTKRKYGGTGLGLSISRELAHALGGTIHLHSEERKGSTFTLVLPRTFDASNVRTENKKVEIVEKDLKPEKLHVAPGQFTQENISVFDDRANLRDEDRIILIIEDDENFAKVLLALVRERKYKGIVASQGNTGLSFARHYRPDAILLDLKLPVMDGMEVLKQLKNDSQLRHIPVQILSFYDHKKEGLQLGAFDYLMKPVTKTDLQKAFDKIEEFRKKKLKKLLIIEDNSEQNTAIRELIGNGDVQCYSAYNGEQAYNILLSDKFDCIILDLGLPDISGFELMDKIKSTETINKIPIIVYTGRELSKQDSDRLTMLANTVVLKTVDSKERLLDETILFLHRVESSLPKEKQKIIQSLHNADEILKDKKILLVDDDIRNIYSLTNALEEEGLKFLIANNGMEAISMLKNNPTIDLVLMDVMMPQMDGYEATTEIRKMDEYKKLPIIAMTAKAMKGDKEKCLAVGMSDYISKPVNIKQLLSLMRVWLYR